MPSSMSIPQISIQETRSTSPNRVPPHMASSVFPPISPQKAPNFNDIIYRLQKLTLPSHPSPSPSGVSFPRAPLSNMTSYHDTSPPRSPGPCTLDAPFSMSYPYSSKEADDDLPAVIDTFAPRPLSFDLSPTSSSSSDFDSVSSHYTTSSLPRSFEAFFATRSRVVRLYNLPASADSFLSAVFVPQSAAQHSLKPLPIPVTMWVLREGHPSDGVWAVFKCHEEACAALSLSGSVMSVTTALESDLEPFHKLRRFELKTPAPNSAPHSPLSPLAPPYSQMLHISSSYSDLQGAARSCLDTTNGTVRGDYTISSNPPNPRSSFRLGDWICISPKCAAHNFGRNLACIGCGCPRSGIGAPSPHYQTSTPSTRLVASPRFVSSPSFPASYSPSPSSQSPSYSCSPHYSQYPNSPLSHPVAPPAKPAPPVHPLLTPSGRAFASGGKVQNISSDPLSPCIMYWPDNEPFPEQGQIRPSGLAGIPQPPILNTGNRGPISHQPGDWICLKCNYLNWRRRKVCQTCLPYAEGNGDSISAAVQAERIALLTSVLAQSQSQSPAASQTLSPPLLGVRSQSLTPPHSHRSFVDLSPQKIRGPVHRSQSHFDLGTQYANSRPIYQTSGHRQPSPPHSAGPLQVHAPAPLLPSFLQDIVQSPTLSPASTSSADLSLEESEESTSSSYGRTRNTNDSSINLLNIWRLDGEETKTLSAFALPTHQDLMGGSRKNSREQLRVQVTTP